MTKYFVLFLAIVIFLSFAQKRGWVNFKNKERPPMGNILGSFDEIFSPSRHQSQQLLKEQKELKVEISSSDDTHIHIDLSKK